jgi:thiamine kinase-like enzyme
MASSNTDHLPIKGSITRGPLLDRVFDRFPRTGPFNTLNKFYDELERLPQQHLKPHQRYKDPYLQSLPHDSSITFTHADVHPSNIMVSSSRSGPPRVLALIDWGQAGWYPDYWEYCKMCYTTHWEDEWRKIWIPKMITPREDEHYLFAEYTMCIGGF